MHPRSVFITGANRGLGLGLVEQFLKLDGVEHVFATCRSLQKCQQLNDIHSADNRLHIIELNVRDDISVQKALKKVASIVGENGLDMFINNAAVLHPVKFTETPKGREIQEMFDTNVIAVWMLSQHFLPLLRQGATKDCPHSFVFISTVLGSIEADKKFGAKYTDLIPYKMTKAAVNKMCNNLSKEYEGENVLFVSFFPGHVATEMGGENPQFTVEHSSSHLVSSFTQLNRTHNGKLFNIDMTELQM